MSVRVKICGVTSAADAEAAIQCGADIIGINFYPPSPRAISLERACEIRGRVGDRCELAGVFVNADRAYIEERRAALQLDWLQFHGDEPDEALRGWPARVIRVLRPNQAPTPAAIDQSTANFILVDTFHPDLFGGTGQTSPLGGLADADLSRTFLSGGLTPANVAAAAALRPFAVDVASGVESAPGIKDADKLRSFVINAKSAR
jgi:phosphoribosylanthranilate isomerase